MQPRNCSRNGRVIFIFRSEVILTHTLIYITMFFKNRFYKNSFIFRETWLRKDMATLLQNLLDRYNDLPDSYGGEYGRV